MSWNANCFAVDQSHLIAVDLPLVELLVMIAIIGILMCLLLHAVRASIRSCPTHSVLQ